MKRLIVLLTVILSFFSCMTYEGEGVFSEDGSDLSLWYRKPAKYWESEALPVGNGKIGAMIYGGIATEQYTLNEKTLWDGGKGENSEYRSGNRPGGSEQMESIRELVRKGDYSGALSAANKYLTGNPDGYGAYQVLGDLFLDFHKQGVVSNYSRKLDLTQSLHTVSYTAGNVDYNRETFVSYPDDVMVVKLSADSKSALNFSLKLDSPANGSSYYEGYFGKKLPAEKRGRQIDINGYMDMLVLDGVLNSNGMKFQTVAKVIPVNGTVSVVGDAGSQYLEISGCDEAVILLTAATDYKYEYPEYTGRDFAGENAEVIRKAAVKGYDALLETHLTDYKNLFDRVKLDLGDSPLAGWPTDLRIQKYKDSAEAGLEELLFQYGRYLMISSSRPGSLPANLQGMWNNSTNPPWSCDYHANINLQMNYWITGPGNIAECNLPLVSFVEGLVEPGRQTASEFYGCEGWAVNTMINAFGFTAPGWSATWGHFPAGAGWLCRRLFQHFSYTQDKDFLINRAYPVMKEAAKFWLDYLVEEDGKLVSLTSYSPEHGNFERGAMMDHMIAYDLFSNCIKACNILSTDFDFRDLLIEKRDMIAGPYIGKHGQLQEWMRDIDNPADKHRHISHLYALHPGEQISPVKTPELAAAARQSLEFRGDGATGWSRGWKVNFWARLHDGERSHKLLRSFFTYLKNPKSGMSGGGIYSNLLCAHPPFQIDGNFGAAAGIAEMLVQSHSGIIELFPAVAPDWQKGSFSGIGAEGGFEVSAKWSSGVIEEIEILSKAGNMLVLKYGDKQIFLPTKAGRNYVFNSNLENLEI